MSVESAITTYPEHWDLTTLGQLCADGDGNIQTGPFGSQLHAADYVDEGIPSIMPKNISVEEISTEDIAYITDEDAERLSKYLVRDGDIIYSRRGDVEKCSLITEREDGWLCGTGCLRVRLGENRKVSSVFIHAYLSHPVIREWIVRHAIGATMPNLNTSILSDVPVLIPSDDEIAVIENIWSNTTKKIVLNRQINQTLEQIVQAIFKSWFIDFEPVKAKIQAKQNGQDPERAAMRAISGKTDEQLDQLSPEQRQQLTNTAAHFPDELVDSELGEIPKGWGVSNIGNEFDVTMGQSPPGDTYNEIGDGMPFFQGRRDFGWRYPVDRVYCTAPKRLAKEGDTLLSVRAPVGDVNKATSDCCIGRGISALRHKSGCEAYTYYSMQRLEQHFNSFNSEGTVFGSINQKDLKALKTVKPTNELLSEFSRIVGGMDDEIRVLEEQTKNLSVIRDSLLPKLLAGEIPLSDTQTTAEAAIG